jgi:hypothetical protein
MVCRFLQHVTAEAVSIIGFGPTSAPPHMGPYSSNAWSITLHYNTPLQTATLTLFTSQVSSPDFMQV